MIVKGLDPSKQYDWKDELLAAKECTKDYECVFAWKPQDKDKPVVRGDKNNCQYADPLMLINISLRDSLHVPNEVDYLKAFEKILQDRLGCDRELRFIPLWDKS